MIQARYPKSNIGSYPFFRQQRFGVTIVLRGIDAGELDRAVEEVRALVRELSES